MKNLVHQLPAWFVKLFLFMFSVAGWLGMYVLSIFLKAGELFGAFTEGFVRALPRRLVIPLFLVGGVLAGLGAYTAYMSRAFSYLSDDPAACVNCHIMSSYHQSWSRSSHAQWATCNDCHVPQDSLLGGYLFKAQDGLYHAAMFTLKGEPQVIRPRAASDKVILANCIRCHTQLNTEFVKTGMVDYADVASGRQKACWDCHREVPHTRISNLASAPSAVTPFPASPVPDWLKKMLK